MRLKYSAIFLFSLFVLGSCSKKDTVGLFTSSDLNNLSVDYVDTFTVKTSTVAMDSLPTFSVKNDNMILAGSYRDPVLGTVVTQPYFQVSLNGNSFDLSNQTGLVYDSLALVLHYNSTPASSANLQGNSSGYYTYTGDTVSTQTLSLYRINKDYKLVNLKNPSSQTGIALPYFYDFHATGPNQNFGPSSYSDNNGTQVGYLFNTSTQAYDKSQPVSRATFRPRPRTQYGTGAGAVNDSIVFRLPDSIGKAFFQGGLNKDPRFQLSATGNPYDPAAPDGNFLNYLKGFTIVSSSGNTAVLSFDPNKSHLRLHYKVPSNGFLSSTYREFPIVTSPTLFNAIRTDRSGTPLAGIKPFVAIPSEKTGNVSYVQAGSGLMTRIEFPYLYTFKQAHPNLTVNRAELVVQTGFNTVNSQTPSIPWMQLYVTDRSNYPLGVLNIDFAGTPQISGLRTTPALSQVGQYRYFLVQFTGQLLNKTYPDGTALLMGPLEKAMDNSVERVVLGNMYNNASPIRLRLYYSKIANN